MGGKYSARRKCTGSGNLSFDEREELKSLVDLLGYRDFLISMRKKLGLSQDALGRMLGIELHQVYAAERSGRSDGPLYDSRDLIAAYYGMDTEDLFGVVGRHERRRLGAYDESEKNTASIVLDPGCPSPDKMADARMVLSKIRDEFARRFEQGHRDWDVLMLVMSGACTVEDVAAKIGFTRAGVDAIIHRSMKRCRRIAFLCGIQETIWWERYVQ